MEKIFDEIERPLSANGDTCNIRLSSDSHHIEKVKWRAHGFSLNYVQRKKPSSLSLETTLRKICKLDTVLTSDLLRGQIPAT